MTTPIHLRAEYWAFPMDREGINPEVHKFQDRFHFGWQYPEGHRYTSSGYCVFFKYFGGKKKYPKELHIICVTGKHTEDQAKEITGANEYPEIALHGLLRDNGIDEFDSYCIIKKI